MGVTKKNNLNIQVVGMGERLMVDWHRASSQPMTAPPDWTVKIIAFSDRITTEDSPDMELTVYFDHVIDPNPDPDEEPEAWHGPVEKKPRHAGKEHLVSTAVQQGILKEPDKNILYDKDESAILRFHHLKAVTAARLLRVIAKDFKIDHDDIYAFVRAAELPAIKL